MKKSILVGILLSITSSGYAAGTLNAPDLSITPGVLCTPSDPDFKALDYPEKIARCNRNIPQSEKAEVAASYGNIPQADWPQYEFDHLIPLCAGGSDNIKNLWPEPIAQAHEKDKLEVEICTAMKAGTMTQAVAVQKVYDWFKAQGANSSSAAGSQAPAPAPASAPAAAPADEQAVTCRSAANPPLVARFKVIDDNHLDGISLSLNDNGDHEVISAPGRTAAVASRAKSGPLKGLAKYTVSNPGAQDRFDLYAPSALATAKQASFVVYAKIAFEATYPSLTSLSCSYDVTSQNPALK